MASKLENLPRRAVSVTTTAVVGQKRIGGREKGRQVVLALFVFFFQKEILRNWLQNERCPLSKAVVAL